MAHPNASLVSGEAPGGWKASISDKESTTSSDESTARRSSSSLAWPGNPNAMRKRVPLSSVIRRVIVPSCRLMCNCTALTAQCAVSLSATSQFFKPKPTTFMKTETSFRCSETHAPTWPAATRSSINAGTKQRNTFSRAGDGRSPWSIEIKFRSEDDVGRSGSAKPARELDRPREHSVRLISSKSSTLSKRYCVDSSSSPDK
mmetsp:Transcript_23710/g.53918  ORF Transcript_23710/g.53918 Transcript_23710/m.53918 type:complete len:202 (-) Transcript_23710:244-849(-)